MSKLELITGKPHLSYSAVDSLASCGERFRLERVVQVEQEPAWWFIGGSAFHTATEIIDMSPYAEGDMIELDALPSLWDTVLDAAVAEAVPDGDVSVIRAGGRATKEWPNKENLDWWRQHGLEMLNTYWNNNIAIAREGWDLWEVTPGSPAVELVFNVPIGDVLVKGAIDRVYINPDGEMVITDIKTGSRKPESAMQLGVYAVAIEYMTGVKPILGNYYMARKGESTEQVSLLHYTMGMLENIFGNAKKMIEAEIFLPHVSSLCNACGVRKHCTAMPFAGNE